MSIDSNQKGRDIIAMKIYQQRELEEKEKRVMALLDAR
jgi:hypothetical protein